VVARGWGKPASLRPRSRCAFKIALHAGWGHRQRGGRRSSPSTARRRTFVLGCDRAHGLRNRPAELTTLLKWAAVIRKGKRPMRPKPTRTRCPPHARRCRRRGIGACAGPEHMFLSFFSFLFFSGRGSVADVRRMILADETVTEEKKRPPALEELRVAAEGPISLRSRRHGRVAVTVRLLDPRCMSVCPRPRSARSRKPRSVFLQEEKCWRRRAIGNEFNP